LFFIANLEPDWCKVYQYVGIRKNPLQAIRAMITCAHSTMIVADHSKFERNAMVHVADLAELDQVISDRGLAPKHGQIPVRHGIRYVVA
jgi:DeoR/GlpR family transcriptional regulator of sugar metabolism